MGMIALAIIGAAGYGLSRVATGFIPIEDQGYLLATVQLPDGAALGRTQADAAAGCARSPRRRRASTRSSPSPASRRSTTTRRSPMPASPTSCSRTGACAARARISLSLYNDAQRQALADGRRRPRAGAAAAADPGHRQRRRLHHAGRAARRQLRPRQAAGLDQRDGQGGRDPVRHPARLSAVPRQRAAIPGRDRPREGAERCSSRPTRSSRRSPAISARAMSTSSTSSAASSRSMSRATRSSA